MFPVEIFTDGSCIGNPGPGGWGVVLRYGTAVKELSGGERETTNNRMELKAAIHALEALKRPCNVVLYTDSKYLQDGITVWIERWKIRGWKTSSNKPVKNQDLWRRLEQAIETHTIEWKWVKGHNGHPENERVDKLAGWASFRVNYLCQRGCVEHEYVFNTDVGELLVNDDVLTS